MLFFPKHLIHCDEVDLSYDPPAFPFDGERGNMDFSRPNTEYFRNYEERIKELSVLGIQADVILFHFYDFGQWGCDAMSDRSVLPEISYGPSCSV